MIPYPAALEHFLVIFSLAPLPVRALVVTLWAILIGLALLRYFANK